MQDHLEQQLRQLITKFEADVKLVVLRSLQSAFDLGAAGLVRATEDLPRAAVDPFPVRQAAARRTLTPDELAVVRAKVTTLIRQQPGQSTAELARIVGIPSGRLRPQLRQLINEHVIEVEERINGGLKRHTYRAAEPRAEHRAQPIALVVGASP